MNATKTVGIIAVIFYILCWFADQPTRTLYYIGIALPWLSLILSIPTGILCKVRDDKYFYLWGCLYAAATVIYAVIVSLMTGSIWQQLPHMAACACLIAYFSLEAANKKKEGKP